MNSEVRRWRPALVLWLMLIACSMAVAEHRTISPSQGFVGHWSYKTPQPAPQPLFKPPSMLVILTPGMTLDDWMSMPSLRQMMDDGAVGLMNTRTARMPNDKRREPPLAAVLTLAAGARAASLVEMPLSSQTDSVWRADNWADIQKSNHGLGYDIRLGNLADALDSAHIPFRAGSVYPNYVPTSSIPDRDDGTYFAMRSRGWSTCEWWDWNDIQPGCYVQCIGPLGHDESYKQGLDKFLNEVCARARGRGYKILILSPYVNDRAYADDDRLAPVLLWGDGVPRGLLCSPSTRRPGLITNTDIAPTIAAYFGATLPSTPFGRPVTAQRVDHPIQIVEDIRSVALEQRAGQKALPYCAIVLGLCLIILAAAQRFAGRLETARYFVSAFMPWLVLTLVVSTSVPNFLTYFSVGAAAMASIHKNRALAPLFVVIPTAGIAFLEVLNATAGGSVLSSNLLGYSAIEGARYYGVGNEAMGVLVGAILLQLSILWSAVQPDSRLPKQSLAAALASIFETVATGLRGLWFGSQARYTPGQSLCKRLMIFLSMLAVIGIVGAPSMGAKAGGVIVLTGAFAVFLMSGYGKRLGAGGIVVATLLGLIALGSMAVLDSARSSTSQSHMGAAVSTIRHGGVKEAVDIVGRKMGVELKLATHSTWAVPVWAGFVCLIVQRRNLSKWRARVEEIVAAGGMTDDARKVKPFAALLDSTLVAALLMLLFNDAGAVACALCLSLVCSYATSQLTVLHERSD